MKLKYLKAFLIIAGLFIILISIAALEDASINENYFTVFVAILFLGIGVIFIINGLSKKILSADEQILLTMYEQYLKEFQDKIIQMIRDSKLYTELFSKLDSIEKKVDKINQKLGSFGEDD